MSTILVHQLWATRKHEAAYFTPELLVAWEDDAASDNAEGWAAAKAEALASLGDELDQWRVVSITIDYEQLKAAFWPAQLDGTVQPA